MKIFAGGLATFLALLSGTMTFAHCQVPCGIYDDEMRFAMISENLDTIEKAMNRISTLSGNAADNANQIVRWVLTKEEHADRIAEILSSYFLAQRIKIPADGDPDRNAAYAAELAALHRMIVYTMKCKQTTDPADVARVRELLAEFRSRYLAESAAHSH